jgi:hypothetical protein
MTTPSAPQPPLLVAGGELNYNIALTLLLNKEEYADRREVVLIVFY